MHRIPRQLARSPHLRVMAWLAWLMLAVAPVHAAPCGAMEMAAAMGHGAHAAQVSDHAQHAMPVKADCCGGQDHARHGSTSTCHCAVTCGTALPVMTMAALAPVAPAALHGSLRHVVAPKLAHAPPLRPPLLRVFELT
ncbi:MAG: hypothetical protein ACREPQ_19115 [Rhodanobacter sp.]